MEVSGMTTQEFGRTGDGTEVELITVKNGQIECVFTTYGGALVSLLAPDAGGKLRDVVLGFDSVGAYEGHGKYIGATIGRFANRIGGASFTLNGETYRLETNDAPNHLHGGYKGFDKRVWASFPIQDGVGFKLTSPHLDGGYPGRLEAEVRYTVAGGDLVISYEAASDRDTVCNLTNHSYFNLDGHDGGTILNHMLKLNSQAYTPVSGNGCIPSGELAPVAGTPLDFRSFTMIGERIGQEHEQLAFGRGYDHNWAVDGEPGRLRRAAEAYSPDSGIHMRVETTLPGIQFYSGNYLDGCPAGKGGAVYSKRSAFCLETQYYPDSPNKPDFPQPLLKKGEVWKHTTIYHFGQNG